MSFSLSQAISVIPTMMPSWLLREKYFHLNFTLKLNMVGETNLYCTPNTYLRRLKLVDYFLQLYTYVSTRSQLVESQKPAQLKKKKKKLQFIISIYEQLH